MTEIRIFTLRTPKWLKGNWEKRLTIALGIFVVVGSWAAIWAVMAMFR